jgi:hypothetical protein
MYILTALVIVAILWFVVRPRIAGKAPDTAEWAGKARQMSKRATAKAGQMYKGVRGRFKLRGDTRQLASQFKQWVADAALPKRAALSSSLPAATESFAAWLSGLSAQELGQFTEKVARYCASVDFDIGWLTDTQVNNDPELKQAVEDAALLYSLGTWRASSVQNQVQVFLAYRAWIAAPHKHKVFGQELYKVMLERVLVTVPSELYLASEQERQAQAATAIRQVAAESPAAFRLALRQLAGVSEDVPPAVPAPVPASLAPAPAAP